MGCAAKMCTYITEEHPWIFTIMLGSRLQIMWPLNVLMARKESRLLHKGHTFQNNIAVWTNKIEFSNSNTIYSLKAKIQLIALLWPFQRTKMTYKSTSTLHTGDVTAVM